MTKSLNLLVVEDNVGDIRLLQELLKKTEPGAFHAEFERSLDSCFHHLETSPIDLVLLDLGLPDGEGLSTLKQLHTAQPKLPIIILTGDQNPATAMQSLKNGAQDYLIKGQFDSRLLTRSIRYSMERFQLFQSIQEERQRYELVALGSNDGVWDWDMTINKVYYSKRWKNMLGYKDSEIGDNPGEWMDRIHPEDAANMAASLSRHLAQNSDHFVSEHRLRHKDGSYRWVLARGSAVFNRDNKPIRIAGSFTDISRHRQLEEDLSRQAYYDPLTRVPNRLLFTENLRRAHANIRRNPQYLFALLFLDVDGFKQVNDHFGHTTGDLLLTAFAKRLKSCLRPNDFMARVGGDEFNILLDDLRDTSEAVTIANRILDSLQNPFILAGHSISVTTSIGIAYGNLDLPHADDLVKAADNAMYRAKQSGKARYEICNPALDLHHPVK